MVWKERNRRVFQNETRNIEFIKGTILQNIREKVLTEGKQNRTRTSQSQTYKF